MKQKHYMDIENIREEESEFRQSNTKCFEVGDIIQITEKWDGSNACCCYDEETDSLCAFSRKQLLSYDNNLNGFWNYVQLLDKTQFKLHPEWRVFGEWGNHNKIHYNADCYKKWYVYDIYDTVAEQWLNQEIVKQFCKDADLIYIHELYYGPFVSWEHCRQFMHSPAYGEVQEGIVVKNQTKLNDPNTRQPFYLKIVNEDFKESMKMKTVDPEVEAEKAEALRIVQSIVTKNRIEKELYKMRDEGIVPAQLQPSDMKLVARNLPKRIYDDCVKEEKELVEAAGEYFGKLCGSQTMKLAREIIIGE